MESHRAPRGPFGRGGVGVQFYLVVLEEEESLDEGEDEVENIHESEDLTLARLRVVGLEVGRDVETVKGDAPNAERCKTHLIQCSQH